MAVLLLVMRTICWQACLHHAQARNAPAFDSEGSQAVADFGTAALAHVRYAGVVADAQLRR